VEIFSPRSPKIRHHPALTRIFLNLYSEELKMAVQDGSHARSMLLITGFGNEGVASCVESVCLIICLTRDNLLGLHSALWRPCIGQKYDP
jgi:hypothetical protein